MYYHTVASLMFSSVNHSVGVKFLATSQIAQFSLSLTANWSCIPWCRLCPSVISLSLLYILLTPLCKKDKCDNVCRLVYPLWVAPFIDIVVNNCQKVVSSPTHSHITSVFIIYPFFRHPCTWGNSVTYGLRRDLHSPFSSAAKFPDTFQVIRYC